MSRKKWVPEQYQLNGAKFLIRNSRSALFLKPGRRKTSITLAALKSLFASNDCKKVLLIAPLAVAQLTWEQEIDKWEDFYGIRTVFLHGPRKEDRLKEKAHIYIVNPEGLDWLFGVVKKKTASNRKHITVDTKRVKQLAFDTIVYDEFTDFKNHSSDRFKVMKAVTPFIDRRIGLTGSPVANGYMGLWAMCYLLDSGKTLGKYITHYQNKYFDKSWNGFNFTLKPGARQQILNAVSHMVFTLNEDPVLLPELVEKTVEVVLPPEAMTHYRSMVNDMLVTAESGEITAAEKSVAVMKGRQISNGSVYLDDDVDLFSAHKSKRLVQVIHTAKVDAVARLVNDLKGAPFLLLYEFKHDLTALQERFGDVPYLGSGVKRQDREQIVDLWNTGQIPLLLGQPRSMGRGLNLQGSSADVGWFSIIPDYEIYDQAVRRVYRSGNTSNEVRVWHFVASGTADVRYMQLLKTKEFTQEDAYRALINL